MNTFILPQDLAHGVKDKLILMGKQVKYPSIEPLPCSLLEMLV